MRRRFEILALPHLNAAHALAYWLMRDRADAEDVVQDAYVSAYRAFDGFRGGDDMRPWLLAIVRNAAWRALAIRRRGGNVIPIETAYMDRDPEALQVASAEPSAEERLIDMGDKAQAMRALEAVAPLFREILVLRELEDMSYADIATVLGVPRGTVMSRLSRARGELRRQYREFNGESGKHAV